ncbi:MbcA/ParS/Xre antitoxin family protein [Novosphingobium profundi]|uniref:MbcA/ParS/Xre antitoxin family protein n=1 Tax=Novosphingobium profundi TaxID=1774954 RepID=UPI001CFD5843|nr:MbcA/ParS/Xre antitoxin family protein [Novosphingobium profundi]
MLAAFLDDIRDGDLIAPRLMAKRLRLPMTRLSKLAHLNRNTMTTRPASPAVQEKLGQIARIITRAAVLTGDEDRAIIWFKHQPLPGWGKTPEELVEDGLAQEVLDDLERHGEGVYS